MTEKFEYFIEETNKRLDKTDLQNAARFDKIDKKLDELISFRLMLLGGAATIATIISLLITLLK